MKYNKTHNVLGTEGSFYDGEIPGTICFVPAELLQAGLLEKERYVLDGWASLNMKAQKPFVCAVRYLFPDPAHPYFGEPDCDRMQARMEALRLEPETEQIQLNTIALQV
jgi:hypothetical protein